MAMTDVGTSCISVDLQLNLVCHFSLLTKKLKRVQVLGNCNPYLVPKQVILQIASIIICRGID